MSNSRSEETLEFFSNLFKTFLSLPKVGERIGTISSSGKGVYGILKLIASEGDKTVSDVSRVWDTSRQYTQKVVNEMIKDGLVTMVDNPNHKRSKFVHLTDEGREKYDKTTEILIRLDNELFKKISREEFEQSANVLKRLNECMNDFMKDTNRNLFD